MNKLPSVFALYCGMRFVHLISHCLSEKFLIDFSRKRKNGLIEYLQVTMIHRITSLTLLLFFSLPLLPSSLSAEEVTSWKIVPSKAKLKAGESFTVKISASINEKWHIYSTTPMDEGPVATSFSVPKESQINFVGKPKQPKPISKFDDAFGINTEYYENAVTFTQNVKVKETLQPGNYKIELGISFMSCNDRMCLPPKTIKQSFMITVGAGSVGDISTPSAQTDIANTIQSTTGQETDQPQQSETSAQDSSSKASVQSTPLPPSGSTPLYGDARDVENARRKGFWAYIGLAMSVGALALLTPCVFPMIPITVSFFTKRPTISRSKGLFDATVYSIGIIITFTVLGLVLAMTLGAAGINQFAANPWVNILIAVIFVAFACNLFGLFEIVIPSSILTKLTVASSHGTGVTSVLLMGLTFTLTSFTCTVPFVGTVMVAASQGDIWWSVLGMLAFSTAFAFPFFLLALFPAWLKSLPKSGSWLNSVKVVMGFLELAAAMKFISNVDLVWGLGVLNRNLFISLWVAIGIVTSVYLLGKIRLPHDSPIESIGVMRMMYSIFFIGISVYLYTGLNGKPLGELDAFFPPIDYNQAIHAASNPGSPQSSIPDSSKKEEWIPDYRTALQRAKKEGKLVFIDFTGFACTNCRWMEANVFPRPEIQALLGKYILTRLYTDGQGKLYDENRAFQESRFGTIALPLYVVMDSDDREIARFPGLTRRPEEFKEFLERALTDAAVTQKENETNM